MVLIGESWVVGPDLRNASRAPLRMSGRVVDWVASGRAARGTGARNQAPAASSSSWARTYGATRVAPSSPSTVDHTANAFSV